MLRAAILVSLLAATGASATEDPSGRADERPWKLTTGVYTLSGGGEPNARALDLNLRRSGDFGNAWIGWYGEDHGGLTQWRAGWDRFFDVGPLRVQPSVQVASGGFRGGSLYAEAGDTWFVGAGAGRTNLRPYVNLNFDPNDMVMLAAGHRTDGQQVQVILVADNREHPDQRHLHLNWKVDRGDGEKLTFDVLAKRGDVDGERIRRLGASVTYDWPRWSLRAAWDPKVNFTAQDMLRLSVAARW
ncbi:hypothetical protein [Ramlibacter algicola]|uniref:hypothetical protein n=1 Tax=Ramlibacter algicola TaxID=2795217 RepID=UPI001EEFE07C|nr:hypothetical protein [Ramlibacter algicola]